MFMTKIASTLLLCLIGLTCYADDAVAPKPMVKPKPKPVQKPVVKTGPALVPASDPNFLGSVLEETWDISHAAKDNSIDCMMSLSDIDLTVVLTKPGPVVLNFDPNVYDPAQKAETGPTWKFEVDGGAPSDRVTIGKKVSSISTLPLQPGVHRVRFVNCANTSSPRWDRHDPQLSRVTGVILPEGAHLEKSQRATSWFLPVTDSIGEGASDINSTTATWRTPSSAYTDSTCAWPALVAKMLNKSIAGYLISGIGIVRAGTGVPYGALNPKDPTGATDAWDHIFEGVPRPFTTAPDFIMLCVGTNEWATDPNTEGHGNPPDPESADAGFQANVETFFDRVRAHKQLAETPIYVSVPFGGFKRTALQKAIADYVTKHPDEKKIELFDLAFGSPALTTTAGIDEKALFGGLTKNRPDDQDTTPSAQASDRTHPYGIATPAIGSVNAHEQLAKVIAPRLAAMLKGGPAPKTGELDIDKVALEMKGHDALLACLPCSGGSAPYTYQFQKSADNGVTWTAVGPAVLSMATTLGPLIASDAKPPSGTLYRMLVTDSAQPKGKAHTPPVAAN
jgi:hypothetical protein